MFFAVGRRRRRRLWRRLCISATASEVIKCCTSTTSSHLIKTGAMDLKTYKRKSKKKAVQHETFELLDEIVWEILIRLPVASLVRFKTVSKAWLAIISDPLFIAAHLQCSKQKEQRNPSSFLITPLFFLEPGVSNALSTDIRFYQWCLQEGSRSTATFLHGGHFPAAAAKVGQLPPMAHCDGLVLLPTNTKAYVFNPATRDAIVLPESHRNMMMGQDICLPIGLGLDTSTGKYKVARAFYRCYCNHDAMQIVITPGMEVFTINGGEEDSSWRETLEDPPYPMVNSKTATHCNGHLFYFIDKRNQQRPLQGLLRFSLVDETFGVTPLLPYAFPAVEDEDILLSELAGELCATFFCKLVQRVIICMTSDFVYPEWSVRYVINDQYVQPMSLLGSGGVLLLGGSYLFRYNLEADKLEKDEIFNLDEIRYCGPNEDTLGLSWENKCCYDLISYTESLVSITPKS